MSKKSNKTASTNIDIVEDAAVVKNETKAEVVKAEKSVSKDKQKNKKVKVKKPNKAVKKLKETGSELKKVAWPSFSKVVKQTGVVLTVVLIFTVILFGIDRLLSWIFSLLASS